MCHLNQKLRLLRNGKFNFPFSCFLITENCEINRKNFNFLNTVESLLSGFRLSELSILFKTFYSSKRGPVFPSDAWIHIITY